MKTQEKGCGFGNNFQSASGESCERRENLMVHQVSAEVVRARYHIHPTPKNPGIFPEFRPGFPPQSRLVYIEAIPGNRQPF